MKAIERRDFLRTAGAAVVAASNTAAGAVASRAPINRAIRAGIYGTQHGHLHGKLKAMLDSPDYEVTGIYEPVPEARERLKNDPRYKDLIQGIPWVSEDQLLGDSSIDLIIVECRVWEAIPWGRKVIDAGKHLNLEKPPANKMEPFQELVEDARRKNLLLQMGYIWRFHEGITAAIEAVRKGWLGDVYMMRGTINTSLEPRSRAQAARYKGGIMFELGCHQIDRADEVDNPRWKAQWVGKKAFDESWNTRIEVLKGKVNPNSPNIQYQVDGLSGATITSRGVRDLLRYWLGENGFGPFLNNIRTFEGIDHG